MIRETYFQEHLLVLEHINRFSHYEDEWDVPYEITNKGIQEYLKCGKEKSGKICAWLVAEGWMIPKLKHIVGQTKRLVTYYPTAKTKQELASPDMAQPTVKPVATFPPKWIWDNRIRKWTWLNH